MLTTDLLEGFQPESVIALVNSRIVGFSIRTTSGIDTLNWRSTCRDHTGSQQGMPANIKEVVLHADAFSSQSFFPDCQHLSFSGRLGDLQGLIAGCTIPIRVGQGIFVNLAIG